MAEQTVSIRLGGRRGGHTIVDAIDGDLGRLLWCKCNHGYAVRRVWTGTRKAGVTRTTFRIHREIAARMLGRPLDHKEEVDHINGKPLDNRRENLRVVSHQQNLQHRTTVQSNNTSGYRGVGWLPANQKWRARVKHNGIDIHVGLFDDPHKAALAAKKARESLGFLSHEKASTATV